MRIVCGPCQVESVAHVMKMAEAIKIVSMRLVTPIVFKASFDKANRLSGSSRRGAGIKVAIEAFKRVRSELQLPILTDVHETWQCDEISPYVDVIQIPALLCRQTDLIVAAARTTLAVNIKKGQFMAPAMMSHAVLKAQGAGASEVWLTERGTTFGHGDLVVDMRSIPTMKQFGIPVLFDATHSVQTPGSLSGSTGGHPEMSPFLARAAIAAGADGIFVETHDDPMNAPSDGAVMLPLDKLYGFLKRLLDLSNYVKRNGVEA